MPQSSLALTHVEAPLSEARGQFLRRVVAIATAYALTGALSLWLRVPFGDAAAIWPPAGIALAALLLYGNRYAIAIVLGNFVLIATANLDFSSSQALITGLILAAVTALGAALQALVGATLVADTMREKTPLAHGPEIARFILLGGALACTINSMISVASLVLADAMPLSAWLYNWWTWWIGDTIGVVIFAPIVLMWFGPPSVWRARRAGTTLALTATCLACVAIFYSVIRYQWIEMRQSLDEQASVAATLVGHRLDGQREAVNALRSLIESNDQVTATEFERHANERLLSHPELLSIGWAPRIAAQDRSDFEAEISRELGASTQVSDVFINLEPLRTSVIPAAQRAEYFPIRFRVRRDSSVMRVGMDLAAYADLQPSLRRAMETGATVVSPPFRATASPTAPREVAMITPVFDKTLPMRSDAAQRHEHFLGFVVVGANLARLTGIAAELQYEERFIDVELLDSEEAEAAALLARESMPHATRGARAAHDMVAVARIPVGNREWLLTVSARPEYLSASNRWVGWWVLAGGLIVSMLVCVSTLLITGRNESVQSLVEERTATLDTLNRNLANEIAERKRAESALLDLNLQLEQRVLARTSQLQQQTEELLAAKEERSELLQRLTMAMHSAGISMWEWDIKTDIVRITEGSAFTTRMGGRTSYRGGDYASLVLHPDEQAGWADIFVAGMNQPPGQDFFAHRYRAIYPDGSLHWIQFHCRVIRNSIGKARRVLGVDWDVTQEVLAQQAIERHAQELELRVAERTSQLAQSNSKLAAEILDHQRAELELRDATLRLQEAMQAKDTFLANISHELRTPLTSILGYAGTLLMGLGGNDLSAMQRRHLDNIKRSGEHLLSLINDLLDLSKAEAGKTDIVLESLSCAELAQEVQSTLQPLADNKGLQLDVVVPDADLLVRADRRALQQILLNLVSNAIKFTDRGAVTIEARRAADHANRVAFSVRDTGIGIGADDQAHLFQAFSRVYRESTKRREGTGLGLHLSRKLARLMNGDIGVRSELGNGSEFTLELDAA